MATESTTQERQQPVVLLTAEQHAAQTIARELAEMRAQGIKLDESVPGGVFEDAPGAGTYHDAHGRPVTADGDLLVEGAARVRAGAPGGAPGATGTGGPEVTDAIKAAGGRDEDDRADMEAQRAASAEEGTPNLEDDEAAAPTRRARRRSK